MQIHKRSLSYQQRPAITDLSYLFIICVIVPFAIGHNIFDQYSFIFSLVLVNLLHIPAIVLFYRWLLPFTFGRKRYALFLILFPAYLLVYELNSRLASLTVMHLPFTPQGYRSDLASGHPESFDYHLIIQNLGWTSLVLLAATSLYMMRRLLQSQHNLYQAETEKLRLELNHLKGQIQPHFFFNTLNNLYSLSIQGSPKTSPMIADLSAIMRYVLYEAEHEKVSLQKDVEFIKSYVQLERIRHDDPDIIDFAVQGDITPIEIEPLLFLPLIENAFKHALQKSLPGKYVKMALVADDDELIFQVCNPLGQAFPVSDTGQRGGIGLKNVKKRLELLYPGRHTIETDTSGGIFNVILTIRLKE